MTIGKAVMPCRSGFLWSGLLTVRPLSPSSIISSSGRKAAKTRVQRLGVEAPGIAVTKTKNPHASRLLSFGGLNLTCPLSHPTLKDVNVIIAIAFETKSRTLGGPESLVY